MRTLKRESELSEQKADVDRLRQAIESESYAFDNMMQALDVMFHMMTCPNHTEEERMQSAQFALEEYRVFSDEDFDDPTALLSRISFEPPPGTKLH